MTPSDSASPNDASARTLCIDIGGNHVKAAVVGLGGRMLGDEVRIDTPTGKGPAAMVAAIADLVAPLPMAARVSIGFPGAVRNGMVLTAPNIGGEEWHRVPLADMLAERLRRPVRLANDATVQGLGAISGVGLECAITLGTGMGFAVFDDGHPGVHLELSQQLAHKGKTYDQYIGDAALEKLGPKHWNRRVGKVIRQLRALVNFDLLYIGGGNAKRISFGLPPDVHIVSNVTGIVGGVRLWHGLERPGEHDDDRQSV